MQSTFVLGSGGSINPLTQEVTFQLGGFTIKIPAGSFHQQGTGQFVFQGIINGVALNAEISSLGGASFSFHLEGAGVSALPCGNPVMVKLIIGNNTGTISVRADF